MALSPHIYPQSPPSSSDTPITIDGNIYLMPPSHLIGALTPYVGYAPKSGKRNQAKRTQILQNPPPPTYRHLKFDLATSVEIFPLAVPITKPILLFASVLMNARWAPYNRMFLMLVDFKCFFRKKKLSIARERERRSIVGK